MKTRKADLIMFGDVHLREDTPVCRTDDFAAAQIKKLLFIRGLQEEHGCPVLCSGDLFDTAIPTLAFFSAIVPFLPARLYTVYGNHDLPNHSMNLAYKSGIYALAKTGKVQILPTCHYGQEPSGEPSLIIKGRKVLVWHVMTYKTELPYPGCTDMKARSLLHKYPQYDLVLTGDNHAPFTQEYKGRLLVNPGSMMRQTADQMGYKPAVWLYYADTNTVEPVYLPIEKRVVTREHIEVVEEKENRIMAFLSSLNTDGMKYVSFKENLKVFLRKNQVNPKVEDIIYEMLED